MVSDSSLKTSTPGRRPGAYSAIAPLSVLTLARGVLLDPLRERTDRYLAVLAYHRMVLELIVDTHTHADHRTGTWELRDLTGARVVMHRRAPAPHIDIHVNDDDELEVGNLKLRFLHTPGHTPDSISIYTGQRVFTGDTLMIRGTGARTSRAATQAPNTIRLPTNCSRFRKQRWSFQPTITEATLSRPSAMRSV